MSLSAHSADLWCAGHDVQENLVAGDRSDLCLAGRIVPRRSLRDGLSRDRYASRGTDFRRGVLYVDGLPNRLIRVTEKFKLGVVAATGGIAVFYLITMVLSFFHIQTSLVYGNGTISILISLFVVGVAALNLVMDFDFIEQGAAQGAPRYMEWYGAFGLMVTLVWLYLEILRLLSKLNSRR